MVKFDLLYYTVDVHLSALWLRGVIVNNPLRRSDALRFKSGFVVILPHKLLQILGVLKVDLAIAADVGDMDGRGALLN